MKLDFCVSHNYTSSSSAALLLHRRHRAAATLLLLPLYMYIHCFFRIEKNHPGIAFFARDYASRDQTYHFIHLILRLFSTPTVRTRV